MKIDKGMKELLLVLWLFIPWAFVCALTIIFAGWIAKEVLL